jgi:hypothetical protein
LEGDVTVQSAHPRTARRGGSTASACGHADARRPERGLSLLEVLFSGFVLTIAGVGLAATLAQAGPMNETSREDYAAWNAIRNIRSQLTSVPFPAAALTFHEHGFDVPGLRAPADDTDGQPGEIVFDYGPEEDTSFYRVTLRVRWAGIRGARVLESQVYLANVRGDVGVVPPLSSLVPPVTEVDPDVLDPLLEEIPVVEEHVLPLAEVVK